MKTHWKKLHNPNYLGAYSLGDIKEITLTIDKVIKEIVTGDGGKKDDCTVVYFRKYPDWMDSDLRKPMILNSTNSKIISKNFNTPFIEDWAGKNITVYVAKIKAFGEDNVEALRVKKEDAKLPELTESHPSFNDVYDYVKKGGDLENVKKKFTLSNKIINILTQ